MTMPPTTPPTPSAPPPPPAPEPPPAAAPEPPKAKPTVDGVIKRLETIASWHNGRQKAMVNELRDDVQELLG